MESRLIKKIRKYVTKLLIIYEKKGRKTECINLAYVMLLLDNLSTANVMPVSDKDDLGSFDAWRKYADEQE